MKQIIHNIRQKPDHHKNRIVWITALIAVAVLLGIWAIVGNGRKTSPDDNFFQSFNQDLQSGQANSNTTQDINSLLNSNSSTSNTNQ